MKRLRVAMALLVGGTFIGASGTRAEQQQSVAPGCAKVVAVLDQGGGGLSAEEIAKKTNTDVETVRSCTDSWRASHKDSKAVQGASGGHEAVAPGCAKVVAVLDQHGGLSADEIAKKASTDVETVRSCTDTWRRGMKSGASP